MNTNSGVHPGQCKPYTLSLFCQLFDSVACAFVESIVCWGMSEQPPEPLAPVAPSTPPPAIPDGYRMLTDESIVQPGDLVLFRRPAGSALLSDWAESERTGTICWGRNIFDCIAKATLVFYVVRRIEQGVIPPPYPQQASKIVIGTVRGTETWEPAKATPATPLTAPATTASSLTWRPLQSGSCPLPADLVLVVLGGQHHYGAFSRCPKRLLAPNAHWISFPPAKP